MMTYTIETRPADSDDDRDWTTDGIGDANVFDSPDSAWDTIGELQRMGDDWARAQYRVVDSDGATEDAGEAASRHVADAYLDGEEA